MFGCRPISCCSRELPLCDPPMTKTASSSRYLFASGYLARVVCRTPPISLGLSRLARRNSRTAIDRSAITLHEPVKVQNRRDLRNCLPTLPRDFQYFGKKLLLRLAKDKRKSRERELMFATLLRQHTTTKPSARLRPTLV